MKNCAFIVLITLALTACGIVKPHEKAAQEQAQKAGLAVANKPRFDATFISSTMHFDQYKKIKINDLDLRNVKILEPNSQPFNQNWELTDDDRRYYQTKYAEAAKKNLIDSGLYSAANEAGPDTLLLVAKITQIAPLAPKDDFKNRPNRTDIYSEGFGRMTIAFEVYDSATNKLVMNASDEHELGQIWEKNNRAQNNIQIRLAFEYWLKNLKQEFEHCKK